MNRVLHRAYKLLAAVLALLLVLVGIVPCVGNNTAWADAVSDAQAVLNDAEAQMSRLTTEYNELAADIDSMQADIDELSVNVKDAQDAMLSGRDSLSQTVLYEYRSDTMSSMISILLGSATIQDLLQNIEYIVRIMQYYSDEVAAQKERRQHFQELSDQITKQKDAQETALSELESKCSEAQQVVNDASAKLSSAQAEAAEAERLAALQAQAAQLAQSSETNEVVATSQNDANQSTQNESTQDNSSVPESQDSTSVESSNSSNSSGTSGSSNNSGNGGTVYEQETPSAPSESYSSPSYEEEYTAPSTSGGGGDSSSGWLSGVASAYGGSTDSSTPNPSYTATGAICDDYSMGVAVPMSLANYRSYFGRTVEISYGGMTVYATVNDCGSMGGGSRALDLQPGVFKAFGFSSCDAWGLRTVSYRFL